MKSASISKPQDRSGDLSRSDANRGEGSRGEVSRGGAGRSESAFRFSVSFLKMGVGQSKEVQMVGGSQFRITSSDESQIEIVPTESGFVAKAHRPGDGFITATANGITKQINFAVRHFAAVFPEQLTASVNGKPALPGTVKGAVESALKLQTKFAPLADLKFQIDYLPALGSGVVLNVPVKVKVTAPGTIEREGTVTVKVSNLGIAPAPDDALWYCNDPERVDKPGPLFANQLVANRSARMLYHHINVASYGMIIRTLLVNDTNETQKVLITPGDSAPDTDPVGAGLRAGDLFFRGSMNGSAELLTLPPRTSMPVSFRRLAPKQVISGLFALRHIEGTEGVLVRTDAFPSIEVEPRWRAALTSSTPWREVGSQVLKDWDRLPFTLSNHVYPDPYRQEKVDYKIGNRFATVRLGQKAIGRADEAGRLDGNFGVTYSIDLKLSNPLRQRAEVEIVFETSAGYSGGIFQIDDQYLITPKLLAKKQARIARFWLNAGEERNLRVKTLPLSGSSYPATLFIRPVGTGNASEVLDLVKKNGR